MASFEVELCDNWKPGRRGQHRRILACVARELDKARSAEEWIARRTLYSKVNGGVDALSAEYGSSSSCRKPTVIPPPSSGSSTLTSIRIWLVPRIAWGELVEDLREVRWGKVPPWLDPGPQSIVVWDEASFARSTTLRRAPSAWSADLLPPRRQNPTLDPTGSRVGDEGLMGLHEACRGAASTGDPRPVPHHRRDGRRALQQARLERGTVTFNESRVRDTTCAAKADIRLCDLDTN
ncbi:hypothetical protein B0H14DRAFT_3851289 [Mycena olivaceomarginata]|nr:hypothetical protein B0H14DRAFT_3851289 [Mycena olivaceomarginata]